MMRGRSEDESQEVALDINIRPLVPLISQTIPLNDLSGVDLSISVYIIRN